MKRLLFILCSWLAMFPLFAATPTAPLVRNVSRSYEVTEGLEGKQIALWGSHGMFYNKHKDRWMWQRARVWTTVEDLFTSSFIAPYLVPMLENAGAVVMQPRAYLRPGYQTIYIRWMENQDPLVQTIHLQQGTYHADYEINTAMGLGVWHYLCTLPKGDYELTGVESMAVDEQTLGPSGWPRYMEAACYWLPSIGIPHSVCVKDETCSDYINDIACRGAWVNYLCGCSRSNPRMMGLGIPLDLCLAIHTDAGTTMTDSIIGSLAIYTDRDSNGKNHFPNRKSRKLNAVLADSILKQMQRDIEETYSICWTNRGIREANYGESRTPVVPSLILELLSHQNLTDMRYALDPNFRFLVARAIYKGAGRYLAAQNDTTFVPQPLSPVELRTAFVDESIQLSWQPQTDWLEPSSKPTYYIVYARENGGTWDSGTRVEQPFLTVPAYTDTQFDFCVAAGNAGGISMRSSIVSAYCSDDTLPAMLIVDAFPEVRGPYMMGIDSLTGGIIPGSRPIPDGLEMAYIGEQINYNRRDKWHMDDDCGFGHSQMNRQGQLLVGNTHDYIAMHGNVLRSMHRSFVSCTMDALCADDSIYTDIDIILGKSSKERVKQLNRCVTDLRWAVGNSHVLMSGAYMGYPAHACASGSVRMDSTTYSFYQELNTTHLSAEDVSALSKNAPSDTILARYSDTSLPAIISNKNYTLVGFPLECLENFETIYKRLIQR